MTLKKEERQPLKLDLQFFAEKGDETEGNPTTPTEGEPSNSSPEHTPADEGNQSDNKQSDKTFTQAELDAILEKRLKREKEKFSDYDDLKTKLTDYEAKAEEERRAKLSEIERAKEEAAEFQRKYEETQQKLEEFAKQQKQDKIQNEFIKLATQENIAYLDDALVLAKQDLAQLELGDDGKIAGLDAIIKSLVDNKPFLLKSTNTKPPTVGDKSNPPSNDGEAKSIEEQLDEAKRKRDFNKVVELSNKLKKLIK